VFLEKRLQAVENKEALVPKESEERKRGCKLLKTQNDPNERKTQHPWSGQAPGTEVGAWRPKGHTPGATGMVIKARGLPAKQFVRL
jgi:hypothetical protein